MNRYNDGFGGSRTSPTAATGLEVKVEPPEIHTPSVHCCQLKAYSELVIANKVKQSPEN